MNLEHFRMLIHELLKKYPDTVPGAAPLIISDSKSTVFMANNVKDRCELPDNCPYPNRT